MGHWWVTGGSLVSQVPVNKHKQQSSPLCAFEAAFVSGMFFFFFLIMCRTKTDSDKMVKTNRSTRLRDGASQRLKRVFGEISHVERGLCCRVEDASVCFHHCLVVFMLPTLVMSQSSLRTLR